jgi:SnoaL-like domain
MRSDAFIEAVHSMADGPSRERFEAVLHPEVRFSSPVTFRAYEGRELVATILAEGPAKLFEEFEYVHVLEDPEARVATLIFRTRVGDRWMDGLDLLTFDEDGLITELKVMLRPKSGVDAMAAAMKLRFEELGLSQPTA